MTVQTPPRVVTAASLFDGHDASINIIRRVLQAQGAEVVHLGHDRSVEELVTAVVHEDADIVAVSSYQGGHVEYFEHLAERLAAVGAAHVQIVGGGGGVIVPEEIERLSRSGVTIFSPQDGQRLGLEGMVAEILAVPRPPRPVPSAEDVLSGDVGALARALSWVERSDGSPGPSDLLQQSRVVPVLGITGTGGSGKSSLTDELVRRFRRDGQDKLRVAVLAVDPTKRRDGGALLGDRIRMNSLGEAGGPVFFRSMATRGNDSQIPAGLKGAINLCSAAGFDVVIVETPGIGQGDAAITEYDDVSLYVMTPEFGAAGQLEKIDMLDLADVVAVNKFDRRGAADALRDVGRQLIRSRKAFGSDPSDMPVYGTSAATFDDDGVNALYCELRDRLWEKGMQRFDPQIAAPSGKVSTKVGSLVPPSRAGYLAEIAASVREHHTRTEQQADVIARRDALELAARQLRDAGHSVDTVADLQAGLDEELDPETRDLLQDWPVQQERYASDELVYSVRGQERRLPLTRTTLSGNAVRRVSLPQLTGRPDVYRYLRKENLPGRFPYTAGVFELKRDGEDPARMFAGEGDPARTNRRFKYLSQGAEATRLSTAFDSVTLYGRDPSTSPDVYGKVGTSGVSIATIDDIATLYDGFDLVDPSTSVSMTINGPAPTILAFFLNAAIDQQVAKFRDRNNREPDESEYAQLRADTLRQVRGTVQADILKEDQGQNTCIFSTEFSLRTMADIAEWFVQNEVRNFYSVSISGYHIAEAGANPISQLAFTLANAFTYVETYLARGLDIDDFAPNLSFFFSNGMDAEYTVIGRVARRIWAIAMRDRYGAGDRSQKLKYHVQTSGRSLHAQEMDFNDIRTTLQALCALQDNANSLHTNAFDEAITTPTEASVRRALAIQLIINREWGMSASENSLQGSFAVEELTDLVEAAVLTEFDRISERGGVLGAMETGYQRGRIQDESMLYEHRKHDGSLPIIGVNTFLPDERADNGPIELARGTEEERQSQLNRLADFHARHADEAPAALERLRKAALAGDNLFAVLMDVARVASLGQITETLFEVGGRYRRSV